MQLIKIVSADNHVYFVNPELVIYVWGQDPQSTLICFAGEDYIKAEMPVEEVVRKFT